MKNTDLNWKPFAPVSNTGSYFGRCPRDQHGWCMASDEGGGGGGKDDQYYERVTDEQSLRQAVEDDPDDEVAMHALADYYLEQGQEYVAGQIRRRQEFLGEVDRSGKFEGGEIYAPYYYEAMLDGHGGLEYEEGEEDDDGMGYDDSPGVTVIEIDQQDRMIFPEIDPSHKVVRVYESDQGFVYVSTHRK